ncbi:DUF366 family protein [Desulfofundulus thermocisternus]|jgi:hypothetical protein|uniref:DUF366 family protein n=1 Tax=Desulfofundulus thermocisternus TaxID=42471 RepID=UPI000485B422|nr:DUF366 family protein [Desulfofundulus thermocisternus]
MHFYFAPQILQYDGTQLASLWAYRSFGLLGDSIVAFRGPCCIHFEHMVDLEDVRNQQPIYGNDMLHFIVEHFDHDLEKTILRQRLFITVVKEVLEEKGYKLVRSGDDLYYQKRKLSISIATATPVSTIIHTALNISAENTPVPAVGLIELGWPAEEVAKLAEKIGLSYIKEMEGIQRARCKVKGVR